MKDKRSVLSALFFLVLLAAAHPLRTCRADSSDGTDDDGTKKTYYWQGSQINNLNRLGGTADFEKEERTANEGKDSNQYLTQIREQMAHKAQQDAQNKTMLTYQGQLPGNPIELTYLSPGVRITLHVDALFDVNSTSVKVGAVDTLERLRKILETEEQQPLQFVIADTLDDLPEAKDVDAERSLLVLSLLQLPEKGVDQEDLTPEVLTK